MTETEAKAWIRERFGVSREATLSRFADMLCAEGQSQNLVSAATIPVLWARHIVDSAQLVNLASAAGSGPWLDIGSGAGLPGLVAAILDDSRRFELVEPRRLRAAFLERAAAELALDHVAVICARVERSAGDRAAIISARAVASLETLFAWGTPRAAQSTLWLLPKGRNAQSEVAAARKTWQGSFHVERSVTDPESSIVLAREVMKRP